MGENYYSGRTKSKTREIALIVAISAVVIILACAGIYFVLDGSTGTTQVDEYLNIANQFVENKDYKKAISNYWKAIELDQYNESAYIELGGLYETISDYDTAMSVYELGYKRTNSPALSGLIDNMVLLLRDGSKSEQKKPLVEVPLTISRFALEKLSVYTYERYCQSYGTPQIETTNPGSCTVSFKGLDATLYYYNTDGDPDAVSVTEGVPRQTKLPNEISLKNLSLLFGGMADKITYNELSSLNLTGLKQYYDDSLKKNVVEFSFSGFRAVIECDSQRAVSVNSWNRLYPVSESNEDEAAANCSVIGKVINAVTGEGVEAATVQIFNREDESLVAEISTDSEGEYEFNGILEGQYVARVVAEGFIEEDFNVDAYTWDNSTSKNLTISPELAANEIRIVLEWGSAPQDLDSYLFGRSSKGDDVKIWFGGKTAENADGQIAALDVDDMDGYGPETTTIYDTAGEYEFVVADFNRTGQLGVMGATVKIYTGTESSPIVIEATTDAKDIWDVCRIKNGEVEIVNSSGDYRGTTSVTK